MGVGSTTLGINCLLKYPDQFSNVSIFPVAHPHIMSKFFGSVNEVDSHNKSRQSNLALEKFWVTQCCYIWLFITIAMGMKINNCWKLFHYVIKRYHYDKFIGTREFLEQLDMDCFSNLFTTYTGMPTKNIPYIDESDK